MLVRKATGLFFAAVISAFGQTAAPITASATSASLPPMSLAVGETAQVNVVNTTVSTATAPGSGAAGPSCKGSVAFYNAKGTIIGTATSFTVLTGQIFSVALPYASAGASGSRIGIRAVITNATPITALGLPPCDLAYSLETYDTATGVTHTFVSGVLAPSVGPIRFGVSPVAGE